MHTDEPQRNVGSKRRYSDVLKCNTVSLMTNAHTSAAPQDASLYVKIGLVGHRYSCFGNPNFLVHILKTYIGVAEVNYHPFVFLGVTSYKGSRFASRCYTENPSWRKSRFLIRLLAIL